jgi:hypothetical protein
MYRARTIPPHAVATAGALLLTIGLSGCKLLVVGATMWGKEPTKDIKAEYPYLPEKKICTLIWADGDTHFQYPNLQLELAEFANQAIERNVAGVSFAPQRSVVEMQHREPEWRRTDPAELGKRFGADRVLMIELTQYTTREPESPHLHRGRIHANVKVYNTEYPNSRPAYLTAVETAYPPDTAGSWGSEESAIRRAVMEAFAADVARKFYDHKIKVE